MNKAYHEGRLDYKDGKPPVNPYDTATDVDAHFDWHNGYWEAAWAWHEQCSDTGVENGVR